MKGWLVGTLMLGTVGCAHSHASTVVLSVQGLDCMECSSEFMQKLQKEPGIHKAEFDPQRVEVKLAAAPTFDVRRAIGAIEEAGYHATVGAGQGRYAPGAEYPAGADVQISVGDGADVPDLAQLIVPGKITVVDFFADWCGPCKGVDRHLAQKTAERRDLAVRKLNIVSWDSPLARHHLAKLASMPVQVIFAPDGRKIDTITGLDLARLDRSIERAAR